MHNRKQRDREADVPAVGAPFSVVRTFMSKCNKEDMNFLVLLYCCIGGWTHKSCTTVGIGDKISAFRPPFFLKKPALFEEYMKLLSAAAIAAVALSAPGAELVVDPAAAGKSGVYSTIQKAINAAGPGDTVTVRGGTYREFLTVSKTYDGAPLTIRAAAGERVVVSGFEPVAGWKDEGGGLYSARVDKGVTALFVGFREQQCARWPEDGTRLPVLSADAETKTFRTKPPKDEPVLAEIAKDPKNSIVFYYFAKANCFGSAPVRSYSLETGDIVFAPEHWNRWMAPDGNQYSFMNHPALIRRPGDWAFVRDDPADAKNTGGTLYFRPKSPKDLDATFHRPTHRPMLNIGHWKDKVANVVVDGLEFTGSAAEGIKVGATDVTIRNCLVHHNGNGIQIRGAERVSVLSNIVIANAGNGVSVASLDTGLVEGNEIGWNLVDGLVIAGNVSGRPTGTPGANKPTRHVTARRNYIHHHILQAHPDNIQMYRDVADIHIVENFDVWAGQALMAEEAEDIEVRGNVVMACSAVMLICGHGNSHRWTFRDNTLWGAGYGFFSFTGHDYTVERNLFLGGDMPYGEPGAKVSSRGNLFSPKYRGRTAKPWKAYDSLEAAQKALGQEEGSKVVELRFENFPTGLAVAAANGSSVDSVRVRPKTPTSFVKAGDKVELNGDGKLRTVTSFAGNVLSFEPALPLPPFRGVLVMNWGDATSTVIDNRPFAEIGARISTADFMKGDLLGRGARTLPVMPDDVAEAIPDPNNVVVPLRGN